MSDLLKGPTVEKIRSLGLEHQIHFTLLSDSVLSMRVRQIHLKPVIKCSNVSSTMEKVNESIRTPWGSVFQLELEDSGPLVDFELRRFTLPSEVRYSVRQLSYPSQKTFDKIACLILILHCCLTSYWLNSKLTH